MFPASKSHCSHHIVSGYCAGAFCNIQRSQCSISNMNRVWRYWERIWAFSWSLNIMIQSEANDTIHWLWGWQAKTKYYAVNIESSWIRVVKVSKLDSELPLQHVLQYCSVDAYTPKPSFLTLFFKTIPSIVYRKNIHHRIWFWYYFIYCKWIPINRQGVGGTCLQISQNLLDLPV